MSQAAVPKLTPRVALVQIDPISGDRLKKAFEQCGIETVLLTDDYAQRLVREKFEGCVVQLDDQAIAVLESVRSSRSNHRMILYGILPENTDVRRFSKYGINALMDFPLDRSGVLNVARSTCALLLHELRRYVRIPLVIEVTIEGASGKWSGSSREISGGGMSVQLTGPVPSGDKLQLSFSLPDKPSVSIGATVCWENNDALMGFQFLNSDAKRQVVKDWISSFLGLD